MIAPVYVEGKVTCYAYPIIVDMKANTVRMAEGAVPTVTIDRHKKSQQAEQ